MRRRLTLLQLLHVLLPIALTVPGSAMAQASAELERAKASFKAGAAAYGAGDYGAAIEALELAYELTPLPAIAFSLAQAERRQYFAVHDRAHLERAIELFTRYVEQVESGGRRSDALDALGQLEPLAAREALRPNPALPAPELPRRTRVMISAEAQGARVSLDGAPPERAPLIREAQPGKHTILVEAPGFAAIGREVTAVEGELVLTEVVLPALPSALTLSTPGAADVYVDGVFARRGGPDVKLELASGEHRLVVAQAGRQSFARTLVLARGQAVHLPVSLALTPQRKAARGLFVASGGLLATSGALLGAALAHEQRAQDFLARQARRNVTASELAHYRDDAGVRDRLRTAGILGATLSAASAIAALLLHQLDRPDARDTGRAAHVTESAPAASARPAQSRARLSPLVLANGVGLAIER